MTDDAVAAKAGEYLRKPYYRVVLPEEDGTWRGEIIEFPGCIATGQTREEALQSLEETAISWLSSAIAHGQSIPEPLGERDHSGRLVLRLPRSLHKKAALAAELDGVSLNQFISNAVAEAVGERRNAVALGSVWSPENTTIIDVQLHKWPVDTPVSFTQWLAIFTPSAAAKSALYLSKLEPNVALKYRLLDKGANPILIDYTKFVNVNLNS